MHSQFRSLPFTSIIATLLMLVAGCASKPVILDAQPSSSGASNAVILEKIRPYQARFGRQRPLIAVVGDNRSAELTDFVVPFGVLVQSGVGDVIALSTLAGPIKTTTDIGKPGFQIASEATVDEFDRRFPDGADYVIVPSTKDSAELLDWLAKQTKKGATIVSICNGAMVVAMTGLMDGHRATSHWSTEDHRIDMHPAIQWVKNARYVADRNWISSAGVSAALPTSIALVEAIAGHARATLLAEELAVDSWNARHDSDAFQPKFGRNLTAYAETLYTNRWFHPIDRIGIPAATGVNEISLALTVDAYSSTGRSQAFVVAASKAPLRTQHGLMIIPDLAANSGSAMTHQLPALDAIPPGKVLDRRLDEIAVLYGKTNAYGVALLLEYPWVPH